MNYLEATQELFDNFEDTCLCHEITPAEAESMQQGKDRLRPGTRMQYIQTRLMLSIAESLAVIAAKPPYAE